MTKVHHLARGLHEYLDNAWIDTVSYVPLNMTEVHDGLGLLPSQSKPDAREVFGPPLSSTYQLLQQLGTKSSVNFISSERKMIHFLLLFSQCSFVLQQPLCPFLHS